MHEYAKRLLGSLPSLHDAIVQVDPPPWCGGSQRSAILGKGCEAMLCTGGEIVYREIVRAEFERIRATMIQ